MKNTPEDLLQSQLAQCAAALKSCLEAAEKARAEDQDELRRDELDGAVALLNASARLGEALGRLRGETSHKIHVSKDAVTRQG